MQTSTQRISMTEPVVNPKTCASCTHNRLEFISHRLEHSRLCKIWNQLIDSDDPACLHHNPDTLPPTLRASVATARGLAGGAIPLPPCP